MKSYVRLQNGILSDGATSGGPGSQFFSVATADAAAGRAVIADYVAPPIPYTEARAAEYPALGAQLDAIWHAMDEGVLPKVAAFYDPIAAVKAKYPKA